MEKVINKNAFSDSIDVLRDNLGKLVCLSGLLLLVDAANIYKGTVFGLDPAMLGFSGIFCAILFTVWDNWNK